MRSPIESRAIITSRQALLAGRRNVGDAYDHVKHSCVKQNENITRKLSQRSPTIVACWWDTGC